MIRHLNYSNEKNPSAMRSSQRGFVDEPQIIIQSGYDDDKEEEPQCIPRQERNVAPSDHLEAAIDPPKIAVSKSKHKMSVLMKIVKETLRVKGILEMVG